MRLPPTNHKLHPTPRWRRRSPQAPVTVLTRSQQLIRPRVRALALDRPLHSLVRTRRRHRRALGLRRSRGNEERSSVVEYA